MLQDGLLLLLITFSIPLAIIALGAPIALAVRLLLSLLS